MGQDARPLVLITGAAGHLGTALAESLANKYRVISSDRPGAQCDLEMDITSEKAVDDAIDMFRQRYGDRIAAVIHLAAYFDFTGEESPLYEKVNERGTRHLVTALQRLTVERFIYSSTMLVHKPGEPGQVIDESAPLEPQWAYPKSKAKTEAIIEQYHGQMPFAILRLAGLYSETSAVPTLAQQMARIYERNFKSTMYAGDADAGQAMLHQSDMLDLFASTIDRRNELPEAFYALAGESEVLSYQQLQDRIGKCMHGEQHWHTMNLPKPLAKGGAWLEEKAEAIIPDEWDEGEKPFIKPFMVDMASHHYALDTRRAQDLLGWRPRKRLYDELPLMVNNMLADPESWYRANKVAEPVWMRSAAEKDRNPENLHQAYERDYQRQHRQNIWAHFFNLGLGGWLITAPFTMGYESQALIYSDVICGFLVLIIGSVALSPRPWIRQSRWLVGLVGFWVMTAPLLFWAPTAASYMNGTLVGALLIGFSMLTRPFPSMLPTTALTGPSVPPGWGFCPSEWTQRLPIIVLAFVGFFISRYMAAYQLGHIDGAWDPFFSGAGQPQKNGTEDITTSSVSEAWPVPDSGLGALTYMLEILTGVIGSRQRWRTMPWLVLLFGFMIIPLGAVSITFIIIQPIILNTWCTLCLIAAAAMLIQIPYSFDEIIATLQFLRRRAKAGRPWLKILFTGDTDDASEMDKKIKGDDFRMSYWATIKDMLGGGVNLPWNLVASAAVGIWLMSTRLTLGADGGMANADHLIGALTLTVTVTALAEVMRPMRFVNALLGLVLLVTPFVYDAGTASMISSIICGIALIGLSIPSGPIRYHYAGWDKVLDATSWGSRS